MTAKDKAEELVTQYRIILMNEDTECGNEILCTSIAKQCALITVEESIDICLPSCEYGEVITNATIEYWEQVKKEIKKI